MARTALTIAGGLVGAYFGNPQLGMAIGSAVGGAVDPEIIKGPRIGEVPAQTSAEGAPRAIVYGTASVYGNVIQSGRLVKGDVISGGKGASKASNEICIRTYAIRICEGPIAGVTRVWEDDKLVYDIRAGSLMLAESAKWFFGCGIYLGTETQLPDSFLMSQGGPESTGGAAPDTPAYRGTAYMVFVGRDLTDRRGSIPQYRFEVASVLAPTGIGNLTATVSIPGTSYYAPEIFKGADGKLGLGYWTTAGVAWNTGSYYIRKYANDLSTISDAPIAITGSHTGSVYPRAYTESQMIAVDTGGGVVGDTYGACLLITGGGLQATLTPSGKPNNWWSISGSAPWEGDGQRVWMSGAVAYIGTVTRNSTNHNSIGLWSLGSGGISAGPTAYVAGICVTPGQPFFTHLGNDGKFRVVNDVLSLTTYSAGLVLEATETLPGALSGFNGFGIDGDIAVFTYSAPTARVEVRKRSDWSLIKTISDAAFSGSRSTRVIFTDGSCFIQCEQKLARLEYASATATGIPVALSTITADIHARCGVAAAKYDVSELTDSVAGLVLAGDYTGADAIDTLRRCYFFDKSEYDKKLWYPKRGKAVVGTLTIDDLVEVPDLSKREQAIEFTKKLHLKYQHAASGYAAVKATSSRSSPDVRVVGEVTVEVPVVFAGAENEAVQVASKMHKVMWAEAEGEITLSVPESAIKYVPSDCFGLTLRGRTTRLRLEKAEYAEGVINYTFRRDRQSAYTSNLTGVPIPLPTLPPSTIVGDTVLVVADISGRQDSEDDLNYLVAVSGAMPAWYGAVVQRSLDGGASYTNAVSISSAARIGTLLDAIPAASENYTDTTNVVRVQLYRTTQTIDSISDTQFLAEQGAFLLEKADGTHEVMQYRDAASDGGGIFRLSMLHRGRLNSGAAAHSIGAKFVMLEDMTHVDASSGWISQSVTHRGVSFEQAPELAAAQSKTYVGRSQVEWPPASLSLARSGANIVTGSWAPRHRFGTDDTPVASINFQGYRITIVGSGTVVLPDQTSTTFSYDASALGASVTVSVQALNRITGAGPATSGAI